MKLKGKFYCTAFLFLVLLFYSNFLNYFSAYARNNNEPEAIILDSAEKFFLSLKEGNYRMAWGLLSEKSHKTIIEDVYNAEKKINPEIKKEEVIQDFENSGKMFDIYWRNYLKNFDPDLALKKSVWKMGEVKSDKAVIILYIEGDAELKMYKEDGKWRVGLVESFWTRKR